MVVRYKKYIAFHKGNLASEVMAKRLKIPNNLRCPLSKTLNVTSF